MLRCGFEADDLVRSGRVAQAHLEELRRWLAACHLPKCTDERLCIFLLASESRPAEAQRCIASYHAITTSWPEVFSDRDVDLVPRAEGFRAAVLPARTRDNMCLVFASLAKGSRPEHFSFTSWVKLVCMTVEAALHGPHPPDGMVVLCDMRHAGVGHVARMGPKQLGRFLRYLQEAVPVRLQRMHVINASQVFAGLMRSMLRTLAGKEAVKKISIYNQKMDWESFYENQLPRDLLPSDYDGFLPSVQELNESNVKRLRELRNFFILEERQRRCLY